ncbi:MAG: inositol monophosphatase family protein [Anaerolineaceae bacterium]
MKPTLNQMIQWSTQAGAILRDGFGKEHQIHHKGKIDLVTEMDKKSETCLIEQIRSIFPDHAIVTEESGYLKGDDGACWYIDPLDGTMNYAHSMPVFCVSVAFAEHGKVVMGVVYDPMRDECFAAEQGKGATLNGKPIQVASANQLIDSLLVTGFPVDEGEKRRDSLELFVHLSRLTQGVRRLGSAALDMVYVATGRLDGFWTNSIHSWDIAAGAIIAEEAGGKVTDLQGGPGYLTHPCNVLVANPDLHPLVLEELQKKSKK